jgi:uncharacterized membrane protein YdbT with pleckstrin-like domain
MSYYEKVIQPGETLRHVGTLHWIIYVRATLILLVAAVVFVWYLYDGTATIGTVALVITLIWLLAMLGAWIRRLTTEIVVTDRRIIYKTGLISRRTVEMNMTKVETVDVVQSIPGRMFDYGTILIRGVGSSYEPLRQIAHPLPMRNAILAQ